jgi:hypothetical protein
MEIQGIIKDSFKKPYSNKLKIYLKSRRNGQISGNIQSPKTEIREYSSPKQIYDTQRIEAAMKSLPKSKVQDLMDSLLNSLRSLKKNEHQHSLNFSTK